MDRDLRVEAGAVTVLRLYDVAYAIDLDRVEALSAAQVPAAPPADGAAHALAAPPLPDSATPSVARLRLARAEPKAIRFDVPPVEIRLGELELGTDEGPQRGSAHARVYEFGVVSLLLRFPLHDVGWEELVVRANALDRASSTQDAWTPLLERVRALIGPAMERPNHARLEEDYVVTIVQRLSPPLTAELLLETVDLVPLLSGERQPLAEQARRDLLRNRFSYYPTDLAVLTWDHAFLLEPSGDRDVADVLEVANAQLLELRYYDELLDAELPRMYDRVEATRRRLSYLGRNRFADLARSLYTLVAEVTETTERVDNALKVTEDVYLARVYGAALELFRVNAWASAVRHKLAIIRDTYTALYDEAATARAELLELAIVLLIVIELVVALIR